MRFNSPPGWPQPPQGWSPPEGWKPDPKWPPAPEGWQFWSLDEPAPVLDLAALGQIDPVAFGPPVVADTEDPERATFLARIASLEAELDALRAGQDSTIVELDDARVLQEVGIYRYHHPLEDAASYRTRLDELEASMDILLKGRKAVLATDMFTYAGSLAKGRKMVGELSRLMLRAYNAEAENCVRSLRSGNISTAKKRLDASMRAIERLGVSMEMRVNPEYHALRMTELELTADYQMKMKEERERRREEHAQLREQRRAEQELAAQREVLDKERAHYVSALAVLMANGDHLAASEAADRLAEIDSAIKVNDYRIANIRAGYVYVISNVGAFGEHIVKIGMTRRLQPLDRVRELGDASVPFPYDVHALYFSHDAVTLENELHRAFADRRVNWVNQRREFFFAAPAEVRALLEEKAGGLLEFTERPVADQYFQSKSRWPHRT